MLSSFFPSAVWLFNDYRAQRCIACVRLEPGRNTTINHTKSDAFREWGEKKNAVLEKKNSNNNDGDDNNKNRSPKPVVGKLDLQCKISRVSTMSLTGRSSVCFLSFFTLRRVYRPTECTKVTTRNTPYRRRLYYTTTVRDRYAVCAGFRTRNHWQNEKCHKLGITHLLQTDSSLFLTILISWPRTISNVVSC